MAWANRASRLSVLRLRDLRLATWDWRLRWPESRREMGAGYMHTGYYFGFFLAAILNALVARTRLSHRVDSRTP